jgi:RNA recognition motif-containing protein
LNIYVGNLPRSTNEDVVRSLFEEFGDVQDVKLIKDQYSGELRGFGFVEMPEKSAALKAIQAVNGKDLEGRTLVVNEARPRNERGGGQRGGGFRGPRSRSW